MAKLRSMLLVSVWAVAFSGSGTPEVRTNTDVAVSAGSAAFERDDYPETVRLYKLAADQGDATAQFILGSLYDEGNGVPGSDIQAVRFRLGQGWSFPTHTFWLPVDLCIMRHWQRTFIGAFSPWTCQIR